ncbi:MAG: hypothetical protein P4M07_02220 [Xanthobacteraceae bacterium]|nr:hypothetical protein [Xanthobacteraceae bacterium]
MTLVLRGHLTRIQRWSRRRYGRRAADGFGERNRKVIATGNPTQQGRVDETICGATNEACHAAARKRRIDSRKGLQLPAHSRSHAPNAEVRGRDFLAHRTIQACEAKARSRRFDPGPTLFSEQRGCAASSRRMTPTSASMARIAEAANGGNEE